MYLRDIRRRGNPNIFIVRGDRHDPDDAMYNTMIMCALIL